MSNASDKLFIFKKSAERKPGKGIHDEVADPSVYPLLNETPNWRRMLDDFYVAPFEVKGITWPSVKAMVFGYRIAEANPEYGFKFGLTSGDPLGKMDYHIFEHRHDVKLTPIEKEAWKKEKEAVYQNALYAKFTQHPDLKALLLDTGNAQLWRTPDRGRPSKRLWRLEWIRDFLSSGLQSDDTTCWDSSMNTC